LRFRAEFDLCALRGRSQQLRDLLEGSGYFHELPRSKIKAFDPLSVAITVVLTAARISS